ncbi:putative lactone-dependent transcriptional regulator (tetr-family), mmfr [Salinisphaera sp. PC39]|uniref:TetR/AcrR family transcriptional regulator n=1 Tax=Salinisphaera sp. PC39 TaxID=1304156 RepID=UPI00334018FB
MADPARRAATPRDRTGRRARILHEAERLFAELGFHGAALSAIARASGLKNPGLIHHFPTKAQLYRAVLEDIAADLDRRLAAAIGGQASPRARLRAFMDMQVAWLLERPVAVRLVQRELLDNVERVGSARRLPLAGFIEAARGIVTEAQAAGAIAAGPPEIKLNRMIGSLAYAGMVRPTFRQMLDSRLLADERAWLEAIAADVLASLDAGA